VPKCPDSSALVPKCLMDTSALVPICLGSEVSWVRSVLTPILQYYRGIAILILDNTSIVGVMILFGTAIPVSIAILQRYLRNDLHHFYSLDHGNSCNLSVCLIFDNVGNF